MKTKKSFLTGAAVILALAFCITSCRKKENKESEKETTTSVEDNAFADKAFEDMGQLSNEAANGGINTFKATPGHPQYDGLLSACAKVNLDLLNKKITIDFGPSNCLCVDGRYRRGQIYITWTGFTYWDSLANITITTAPTDSYFVDDNQIKGTKSISNNGRNAAGHLSWSFVVNGQIVKANNQGTIQWQASRTCEWIAGENTFFIWWDDVYAVTGSASGSSTQGAFFNVVITSPLIRKIACPKHYVSGTFDFTPGSKPTRHVDFSPPNNGACDDIATVTVNGNTYTIHMH